MAVGAKQCHSQNDEGGFNGSSRRPISDETAYIGGLQRRSEIRARTHQPQDPVVADNSDDPLCCVWYHAKISDGPGSDGVRKVFASIGFLVAPMTFVGVVALIISKFISWHDYRKFYRTFPLYSLPRPLEVRSRQWGVRTLNTWVTLLPDLLLPIIFALAWFRLGPDVLFLL
jgi:hypothetical protein